MEIIQKHFTDRFIAAAATKLARRGEFIFGKWLLIDIL